MSILVIGIATTLLLGGSTGFASSIAGTVTCPGLRDCANAVVYVERAEGKNFQPSPQPPVLDQKAKEFVPKVLPVVAGTTVKFLNSDTMAHNAFTPDKCAGAFNLGTWGAGEERTHTFDRPCEAVILCNLHPEMVAYVIALPTPYFAVTDASGRFTIPNVPDGTYTLAVWHERFKKQARPVTVNGTVAADFALAR